MNYVMIFFARSGCIFNPEFRTTKKKHVFWGGVPTKKETFSFRGTFGGGGVVSLFPKFERCHSRSFVNFKSCLHPVLAILWVSPRDLFGIAVSFIRDCPFFGLKRRCRIEW